MERPVIVQCVAVLRDRHNHVDRVDLQLPVNDGERHIVEVRVRVLEIAGRQAHRIGADISAAHHVRAAEREVVLRVQAVADGHVVARHRVQRAVIVQRVAVLRDRHNHVDLIHRNLNGIIQCTTIRILVADSFHWNLISSGRQNARSGYLIIGSGSEAHRQCVRYG